MSELDNLPKVEIKANATELLNKAYDDTIHPIASSAKSGLGFCINFLTSGIKPYMYKKIKESEFRLKEIDDELTSRYNKIPDKNKIDPRTNILGPAIDVLKYNLEEEHIRNLFTNILISEMDNRKQSKVLPAYIEVVRQLSKEDADTLVFIKQNQIKNEPIMKIEYRFTSGGFRYVSNDIVLILNNNYTILNSIIIDSLLRQNIIEIDFMEFRNDESVYTSTFEQIKLRDEFKILPADVKELDFSRGLLKITDFGENFIDICLS